MTVRSGRTIAAQDRPHRSQVPRGEDSSTTSTTAPRRIISRHCPPVGETTVTTIDVSSMRCRGGGYAVHVVRCLAAVPLLPSW